MKTFSILFCAAVYASLAIADESAQELVTKAVARSRAIKSGRFMYFTDSNPDRKHYRNFFEGRWRRKLGDSGIGAEYGNFRIAYNRTPPGFLMVNMQDDVATSDAVEDAYLIPVGAGSFWHRHQVDWVESHAADFVENGTERIGDIDTLICDAYFKASPTELGPAYSFHPSLNESTPGLDVVGGIRLYIAPSLGYVLPQYEILDGNRTVLERWTAKDFKECAPGIFIAWHIKREAALEHQMELNPATCHTTGCTVSADKVNQPLSDEDLYFEIPAGTTIQVRDGAANRIFNLKDAISSKDLARLCDKVKRLPFKQISNAPIGLNDD